MRKTEFNKQRELVLPDPARPDAQDQMSLDVWGFRDTQFQFNSSGNIELSGNRYALSGHELPRLVSWVSEALKIDLNARTRIEPCYPPAIADPVRSSKFAETIRGFLTADQITEDAETRLRHGHGHTQEEMYAIKHGRLERVPDLVVFPLDAEQVGWLVEAAVHHDICLIPYGGGTSVTEALRCPAGERRTIVSVDLQRMNRILWIDPINRMAEIQAGAVGRQIAAQLRHHGFTMGHEPDSLEFSTLGGWIATHASGMKKNKYGNIEDLVLGMNVVTPVGELNRSTIVPRESVGTDPNSCMFGSEGNFGIITSATVKIFRLPEVQRYGSIIFPSFEQGFDFLYRLAQGANLPASVRLVDNLQFQFSQALKPGSTGWKAYKSAAERFFVTRIKGFDPSQMVACTLVFEGAKEQAAQQEKIVYGLARSHGGMAAGSENGERGYQLTFSIAYIRDFLMNYYVIAESFETSVSWSNALALCENVKRRVVEEHQKRKLTGKPFITCRITQLYDTGVCVYFYFAYYFKGVENPTEVYLEIEDAARDEILKAGGSLSHHHGIGKLRRKFMPRIMSAPSLEWIGDIKRSIDPTNVFGCGNLFAASPEAQDSAARSRVNEFLKADGSSSG
jgi:alkyldihydroxyacetonephosphate synthase